MKIQSKSQISYNRKNNQSFKSNGNLVKDAYGRILYSNYSYFFREDLDWGNFINILLKKYKNVDKVNIYNYSCSDGSEPISLAMLLIKNLGAKKAKKFFPIQASDINEEILKNPRQGIVTLWEKDLNSIKSKLNYSDYITITSEAELKNLSRDKIYTGQTTPLLKDKIIYNTKDITKDIANIERDNSVVICRNFWPYIKKKERLELAKNLSNRLNNNSMCVIGSFDEINYTDCQAKKYLIDAGFGREKVEYCFTKNSVENEK